MDRLVAFARGERLSLGGQCLWYTAALLCWPAAQAAEFEVGIGGGPAHGRVDCVGDQPCDRSGGFGKIDAGYHFTNGVEVGASYVHAGTFKGRDQKSDGTIYGGNFKTDALGLTAGYGWRFTPGWRLSGHVGLAVVRTHFGYDAPFSGDASKTTLQPLAGVALSYALTPQLSVGLAYDETRFKVHETHGPLRMPGVALQYTF